ncbi:TPA: hypothetical protein ACWV7G_001550 [Salmonella enterica subsp. enterica serovar Muenchen]|nr:hypothetical protein [Salmonella enterica subsp. enterica serovar Muenchen]ECG0447455.1 hypothetical protein [Salmonella enterica]ECJ4484598.1 hypothetical protein [Salmonella enterica subsp. diarizonae]EBY3556164.1 hypothetical protein [Salmonella enterica subsp. enterica serovar Muenchen]ECZ0254945.1 hypothetical protein [Salmonella enterica subsp. diarizonae]
MKLKKIAVLTLLVSGMAVATGSQAATTLAFKPLSDTTTGDALSAATGGAFKGALPSYENDGNENTTTRAGLRVRKSSVIVALQHNLGIDVANHLTDVTKFVSAVNKILPADKGLKESDLVNLDNVVISMQPGSQDVLADLTPDSKQFPVVDLPVRFTLTAKPGTTMGEQNADQLVLDGMTKVKLTDYRRVDQSTIMATKTPVHITVKAHKPGHVTPEVLAKVLDNYFDITAPSFSTTLFPVWNIDPASNQPMFTDEASGEPVKHSLKNYQIDALAGMYTGTDGKGHGDFGKARIERAVQKVSFAPVSDQKIRSVGDGYEGNYDVSITFIQHWSWNSAPYTERAASFTLKNVPVIISFKK